MCTEQEEGRMTRSEERDQNTIEPQEQSTLQ